MNKSTRSIYWENPHLEDKVVMRELLRFTSIYEKKRARAYYGFLNDCLYQQYFFFLDYSCTRSRVGDKNRYYAQSYHDDVITILASLQKNYHNSVRNKIASIIFMDLRSQVNQII